MKINELLNEAEQLDEIPKWMGGTGMGGGMPGTTSDTIRGAIGTKIKKFTGMGTGGALLKQAKRTAKAYYKQWLTIVPTLQQSGKVVAGDPDSYIDNLMLFTQKKFGLRKKEDLDKFKATIGNIPNRSSIIRAFEEAFQNAVAQKQLGNPPTPPGNPPTPPGNPPSTRPVGTTATASNGKTYKWDGRNWKNVATGAGPNDRIRAELDGMSP